MREKYREKYRENIEKYNLFASPVIFSRKTV